MQIIRICSILQNMKKKQQQSEHILQQTGLKVTTERVCVLSALMKASKPLSVPDVYKAVKKHVDQSTVYRILDQLVESRIIYQTDFRDSKNYYEFQDHHHHHIVCTKCGTREHINICLPPSVEKKLKQTSKMFSGTLDHTLEFFGICRVCKKC